VGPTQSQGEGGKGRLYQGRNRDKKVGLIQMKSRRQGKRGKGNRDILLFLREMNFAVVERSRKKGVEGWGSEWGKVLRKD